MPSRFHQLLLILAAALTLIRPAWSQLTEAQEADLALWRTVLTDGPGEAGVQRTAARRLLDTGWPQSISLLGQLLGDFQRPDVVALICTAVRDSDPPPEALFDALVESLISAPVELRGDLADAIGAYPPDMLARLSQRLARGGPAPEQAALILALSRFTEVEVVDQLISLLGPDVDPAVRTAALDALVRVTGADYGDSMTRWQSWWRNNRVQGRDGLVRRKLRRLERERDDAMLRIQSLQRDVAALTGDLLTAMNRNYTLADPEQRNALLLTLLGHPRTAVRRLGLDLVEQRVLNAEPVSAEVTVILGRMATDPAAPLRALAVRRLALVDSAGAAALAGPMLADATDPDLETAIISVLGQNANPIATEALIARFVRAERPRGTAAALLASATAGHLGTEQLLIISERLHGQGHTSLSAVEAELLAWCPAPLAGETLRALLQSAEVGAERKAAAARGLAASGLHQEVLLAHAADAAVYPHALRAAGRRGGLEALRLIIAWPVLDPGRFGEEVGQILSSLPPAGWLDADNILAGREGVDLQRRVNSLSRVLTLPQPGNGSNGIATVNEAQRRQMCLRLAELHWRRADPEAMLTALQAAPVATNDSDSEARWRNIALIALERFDNADTTRSGDWVDALDLVLRQRTTDVDRAARIADAIQTGRTSPLSEADRARFDVLLTRLASLISASGPQG